MNCEELRRSLVFYLDGEINPAGRRLMENHLAECEACQRELDALGATRRSAVWALNELTGGAQPSQQAWSRLQARLAVETHSSPTRLARRFVRAARVGGHNQPNIKTGDEPMWNRFLLPALTVVLVMLALAIYMLQNVTPVSAQQILQRAAEAQAAAQSAQGIRHIRLEVYMNVGAEPGDQAGTRTIEDSYLDLSSGKLRRITLDPKSGQVLDAFAYDGAFTYSTNQPLAIGSRGPLTIYRSPQSAALVAVEAQSSPSTSAEKLFNEARNNPNVELSGKETWADGRTVYLTFTWQMRSCRLAAW
jgi:anti-sigma factor RsiW